MKKYKIKQKNRLHINCNFQRPYHLTGSFRGSFPIKYTVDLLEISFYFATYCRECQGRLYLNVMSGNNKKSFDIDMRDIEDNKAFTFEFDEKFEVSDEITYEFNVEYSEANPLALWVNQKGVCCTATGESLVEINFNEEPLISVIMPVYRCPLKILKESINSVKNQKYKNWELCIVDDGSGDKALSKFLSSLERDKKIKVIVSKDNEGIAKASNKALSMATGKYVCFIDNDDMLHDMALMEIAFSSLQENKPDLIYTDECKISEGGKLFDPFYKPDWNYTMFLSQNYVCHLSAFSRKIIDKIGGFREGYDGSQDYDLILRFIEHTNKVHHIPKILYFWRALKGSTANNIGHKISARVNGEKAIFDHLKRRGEKVEVSMGSCPGTYQVNKILSKHQTKKLNVCIIIPFKNKINYLLNLLYSIKKSTYKNYKIMLIDNNSDVSEIRKLKRTDFFNYLIEYPNPFNFSKINNFAASFAHDFELLLFLNNDMEIMNPDWLEHMIQHFTRSDVSAVGSMLLYPDYKIQHSGIVIGMGGVAGHGHKRQYWGNPGYFSRPHLIQEVSAVTGACLMTRKSDFEKVNGFEEKLPKAFNDVDYCLKLRAMNKKIIYTPYSKLLHYESLSRGLDNHKDKTFQKAIEYMQNKWNCREYIDPYYNINLSLEREDFSYKVLA